MQPSESTKILTTVMTRMVVNRSTDNTKPHSICFLPQYQHQRKLFFPECKLKKALRDTSTLVDNGKLANEIVRIVVIVVRNVIEMSAQEKHRQKMYVTPLYCTSLRTDPQSGTSCIVHILFYKFFGIITQKYCMLLVHVIISNICKTEFNPSIPNNTCQRVVFHNASKEPHVPV